MNIAQVSDFAITLDQSLALLWPQTEEAHEWVCNHLDKDRIDWGQTVPVEHRYLGDIVNGIHDAGLTIKDVIDTRVKS